MQNEDCLVEDYEGDVSAKNNPNTMGSKAKMQQTSLLTQAFPALLSPTRGDRAISMFGIEAIKKDNSKAAGGASVNSRSKQRVMGKS